MVVGQIIFHSTTAAAVQAPVMEIRLLSEIAPILVLRMEVKTASQVTCPTLSSPIQAHLPQKLNYKTAAVLLVSIFFK